MRYSDTHKAESRKRIIDSASRQFRSAGKSAVSVLAIMREAGLTHGAFYMHFDSKDALFAEAVGTALDETRAQLLSAAKKSKRCPAEDLITAYLSFEHRDHPGNGCSFVSLGADIARSDDAVKSIATQKHKLLVEAIAAQLDTGTQRMRYATANAVVSAMVGALILSRATNERIHATKIVDETREFLLSFLSVQSEKKSRAVTVRCKRNHFRRHRYPRTPMVAQSSQR